MSKRIAIVIACGCVFSAGCTFSRGIQLPRSADQQLLATQAIARALAKFEFPDIKGKSVLVHVGAPGDAVDEEFLRTAAKVEIVEEGAKVAARREDADLVLSVLVSAMGLNIRGRYLGL